MEQMSISEKARVPFDYEKKGLPRAVCELRPIIFREGDLFRCLLGPDLQKGISGEGATPEAAVEEWVSSLRQRLQAHAEDEATQYARDVLNTSVNDVW
ncbi:hypothetical protein EDD80_102455 [Anseongella ginsenosidimutans]|uniref:Uncharacterized protein n=1 Tax=Anseongella ginsenosidimutans TaxID=496056 RepID=A0A4R3KVU4_9SPHI|nr:hypothetical protein [Anseongella ginsenosidimutans]TCS89261.1 hypothetical protein EDD80_102455 [Anseongella ginsenosidimutans]